MTLHRDSKKSQPPAARILRARLPRDTGVIQLLWLAYGEYLHTIDCYDCGGETIEPELAALDRHYPLEQAALYLLYEQNLPVGTVAFNCLQEKTAEIRRLYVLPEASGKGYGRALMQHAMIEAKKMGYVHVKLDTFLAQEKPQNLYKTLGFRACEAYNDSPVEKTLFMECEL